MSSLTQFFLNPAYVLPGAALVLVPILIHILSRLRYKKVRFAAMEFLLESEELESSPHRAGTVAAVVAANSGCAVDRAC